MLRQDLRPGCFPTRLGNAQPLRLPIPSTTSSVKPRRRTKWSQYRILGILRLRRKLEGHLSLGHKNILLKHLGARGYERRRKQTHPGRTFAMRGARSAKVRSHRREAWFSRPGAPTSANILARGAATLASPAAPSQRQ